MQIKKGNDIGIVWTLLWDDQRIIPLSDAVDLDIKIVNQSTFNVVANQAPVVRDNQIELQILAKDIRHIGKYRLEASWKLADDGIEGGFSSYSVDHQDAFEITPFGIQTNTGRKFEVSVKDILYYGYKTDGTIEGGSGLTDSQKKFIGFDNPLPEGINSLSEGICNTTLAIGSINEVLSARFPFKIISFSGGKIAEKGTTVSVALAWSYDGIPTSQSLSQNGSAVAVALSDRAKSITGITANTTFVLTANGVTASQAISFYNCRYVGVVDAAPESEAEVKALTKLAVASGRSYTWTGSLDNQKVCFCYPKTFGALVSIKDGNGFEGLSGYARSETTVNGELYYVYTSGSAIATNVKQIYS